ncbi:MAG: NTP transferase domain-containing protein [Candidatus Woesearchaeota archaeon]|nr:MAG: NTP transferase domain-containing protein [Candidatus Woesearchaeota archaeon]
MKVIIPLAGMGSRLKPFTLTKAKAMVAVAGKPVLEHILDQLVQSKLSISEVVFVTGYLGEQIEAYISKKKYPFTTTFVRQTELAGQAHAIHLAREYITEPVIIWFVDTIADPDLSVLEELREGMIYVKEVADPLRFGQVQEENGKVTKLEEKADPPISFLVNIGLYYVYDYKLLLSCTEKLITEGEKRKGEFYLMDVFSMMLEQGVTFRVATVSIWEDCGIPEAFLQTNKYLLSQKEHHVPSLPGVTLVPPVVIHETAKITNATIGPYVAVGEGAVIDNATIKNSIVLEHAHIANAKLNESMIGDYAIVKNHNGALIVGPHSILE